MVLAILSTAGGLASILLKLAEKPRWRYFFAIFACLCLLANFSFYCYERQLANTPTRISIFHPNDSDNADLLELKRQFEKDDFQTELICDPADRSAVHYFFAEDRDRANLVKAISEAFLAANGNNQHLVTVLPQGYTAKRGQIEIWIPHMETGSHPEPCQAVPPAPR